MTKPDAQTVAAGSDGGPRSAETRDRILVAAQELLAEEGWAGVTTRSVAERSGVNKALIHYHFGSSDKLLDRAVAEAFQAEIAPSMQLVLEAGDPLEGLARVGAWLHQRKSGLARHRVLVEGLNQATLRPGLRDFFVAGLADFRGRLADQLRSGYGNSADVLADLICAAIDGIAIHRILDDQIDTERALNALAGLIHTMKKEANA